MIEAKNIKQKFTYLGVSETSWFTVREVGVFDDLHKFDLNNDVCVDPLTVHPTHGGFAALREGEGMLLLLADDDGVEGPGSGGFLVAMVGHSETLLRAFT